MKVICVRDCKGFSGTDLFTKGKIYEFDDSGAITDNGGHTPRFHLKTPGDTPLEKWNNHYSKGKDKTYRFYKLFEPLSYRKF